MKGISIGLISVLILFSHSTQASEDQGATATTTTPPASSNATSAGSGLLATFAGGCFWGIEHKFTHKFGKALISAKVGYTGGQKENPTYKEVCAGTTGHAEAAQFEYNPQEVTYEELVLFLWRIHNPTTLNQQGNDKGTQYRSAIFYHSDEQKLIAERIREVVKPKFKDAIVTEIVPAVKFYDAEENHQNYLDKNPNGYCNHRMYW